MSDLVMQRLRRGVHRQAEHVPASEAGQAPRAGDEEEPERAHAAEEVGVGALPGSMLRLGEGLQLKAADQVVGENAELLPDFLWSMSSDLFRALPQLLPRHRRQVVLLVI